MSAFEFFFSFYGLVLGLSVAVIATGFATAIQHRRAIRIGWLTLVLALFVALDIATFWDAAWHTFRTAPYTYGMLVIGLTIALVYFLAASLVFPHKIEDGMDLDDHFWANKKTVLLMTTAANSLMVGVSVLLQWGKPGFAPLAIGMGALLVLYAALVVPAALTRSRRWFAGLLGLHILLYLFSAIAPAKLVQAPAAPPAKAATAVPSAQ